MTNDTDFGFHQDDIILHETTLAEVETSGHLPERFRLIRQLTRGGMGKLYLAQEVLSGRFVALKVILDDYLQHSPLAQQFVREAIITARLEHPNIIPVHDLGFFTEGQLFYTMRYVNGHTLEELGAKASLEQKLRILRNAARAVAYAHRNSLWHRDLKPANILVGEFDDTYVIDWGLVTVQKGRNYQLNVPPIILNEKALVVPDDLLVRTPDAITAAGGGFMGTPAYMAPEQIKETAEMGPLSDIWAFGVMLFEALTGRHPIEGHRSMRTGELLRAVMFEPWPTPRELVPTIPIEFDRLCRRMLERDPGTRMSSLDEFIQETTTLLRSFGPTLVYPAQAGAATIPDALAPSALPLGDWPSRFSLLESEQRQLQQENRRLREKTVILTELCKINAVNVEREKELWGKLALL